MQEACEAAIVWVQQSYACTSVEAFVEPQNQRSIALALRLGMQASGALDEEDGAQRYLGQLQ